MAKNKVEKEDFKPKKSSAYSAESITVLEGLEPVRRRPGMYIGTTGPDGLHHLVTEIFDNSRDEAMGGFANRVEIAFLPDNYIRVTDNGRGIPVDIHKQTKVSALETIMTTLHAGGKFGGNGYKVSGGLHGVGASVVNALSVFMRVEVYKDGGIYVQEYSKGKRKAAVKKIGNSKEHGTIITFKPDIEIFKNIDLDFNRVVHHMRQQAYLVKSLKISVLDLREVKTKIKETEIIYLKDLKIEAPSMTFKFDGGLTSLIKFYNHNQKPIHKNIFYVEKMTNESSGESVEVALQYVNDITARIMPFANNIYQSEGGTHITGFKTALTRTLNNYAKKNNITKNGEDAFTGDDVLEGLTVVVSVKLREIQFEGQTKAKLGSVEARGMVESVFGEAFDIFLEENPEDAKAIINKVVLALRARKAAKAAKDSVLRKGALEGMTLPGKLADCQSKSATESELFIVEGDSAGGTAKTGRDRKTQAILPLRGKILNIERARLDRMLASEQIKNLVVALGTAIGDTFDIEKLRYHKIIIATDADVDGAHIRTLILTLLYRYFRPLIDSGFIYIAQPPLYKIKKGKEIFYAYSDDEKAKIIGRPDAEIDELESIPTAEVETEEYRDTKNETRGIKISVQRYKGLGEMNAEELWETTMDPARRILKQINVIEASEADDIFDVLMGSDVPSRKSFIQSNAKLATLDI
ncbi:MAG: DNA topoisomerase IV subunit B [Candidatus Zambryskibacteria bacterium CG10_big_fil_rev_8_21_14_0_10_34_34]|uniref:DNA topoisomerase (ATP-hydrolyzing) n=1 Tax=Candidatus Zambryskibacteria bacterium CG10_big_fil_rev_8_21_14_0_10_34_34 TaxID=1975114 RepID=A0A2H0R2J0_9BACT|nr:MAG: DNA topoisomerase IV subunit B [Candidatus Zambryskibacteria bacterium CG10_big_fil_rev_8_21_14_0_10_34_34]